jgi:hypothetical protein
MDKHAILFIFCCHSGLFMRDEIESISAYRVVTAPTEAEMLRLAKQLDMTKAADERYNIALKIGTISGAVITAMSTLMELYDTQGNFNNMTYITLSVTGTFSIFFLWLSSNGRGKVIAILEKMLSNQKDFSMKAIQAIGTQRDGGESNASNS